MNQIKTLKILVGILIIMNVCLAGFMWIHRPPQPYEDGPGPRGRGDGLRREIIHELHFSEEQAQQFDRLVSDHQQKMEPIRNRGRELHNQLFDLLEVTGADSARDSITHLIGENRAAGEKILFDHLVKVRGLCNEKQKGDFESLIKRAMMRMEQQ